MATKQPQDSEQEKRDAKVQKENGDQEEQLQGISAVMSLVTKLVKGTNNITGIMLRRLIVEEMPSDLTQAEQYNESLKKLRQIGELVAQASNEEFLVRKNR